MAIYHCNISNVSRAKGSSSVATLSYITGEKAKDERLDKTFDFGRSERVETVGTVLPEHAPKEFQNATALFNSLEKYETADNARTAKKIEVALPREFSLEQQKKVVEDFIRANITSKGYACVYAIHTDKDGNNPHAHILIANRQISEKGEWVKTKTKSEFVRDKDGNKIPLLDENGEQKVRIRAGKGVEKLWQRQNVSTNPLDRKEVLQELREQWAVECNRHLAPDRQIDHRSLADQGKEQIATVHEGYIERAKERRGEVSEVCEYNREVRAFNQENAELDRVISENQAFIEVLRETDHRLADLQTIGGEEQERRLDFAYSTVTRTLEQEKKVPVLSCQGDTITVSAQDTPSLALRLLRESREKWDSFIKRCREATKTAQKAPEAKTTDKSTPKQEKPSQSLVERFKGWLDDRARQKEERRAAELAEKQRQAAELAKKQAIRQECLAELSKDVGRYDYQGQLDMIAYASKVLRENRGADGDYQLRDVAFKKLGELTDLKTREYDHQYQIWSDRSARDAPQAEVDQAVGKARDRLMGEIDRNSRIANQRASLDDWIREAREERAKGIGQQQPPEWEKPKTKTKSERDR